MTKLAPKENAGPKPYRILVAEDHAIVRRGIRALLESIGLPIGPYDILLAGGNACPKWAHLPIEMLVENGPTLRRLL